MGLMVSLRLDSSNLSVYGYELTSLNEQEQATAASAIDVFRRLGESNTSPIHTPFLCYSLATKCRKTESYDVRLQISLQEVCGNFAPNALGEGGGNFPRSLI